MHAQKGKRHKAVMEEAIDSSEFFADGFKVKNFHAEVNMRQDGYFTVTEQYDIKFISEFKHGIIRTLPLKYMMTDTDGHEREYNIKIDSISVPGRRFSQQATDAEVNIRIGEPDVYVTGRQDYTITYRVKNAFFFHNGKPDFYWNFIGAGWNTIFERASFSIHLPVKVLLSPNDYYVYSGSYGDKAANGCIAYEYGTIYGEINGKLPQHHQLTVLAHLPQGYVYEQTAWDKFIENYGWTFFPAGLVIIYFTIYFISNRKKEKLVVVQVQPPKGIDPAMAGFIANNSSDASDIISLIPYWGAAGYIRITQIDEDETVLHKIKDLPADAPGYQQETFNGIFLLKNDVRVSSLKYVFFDTLLTAESSLSGAALRAGFYAEPIRSKGGRAVLFIFLGAFGWFIFNTIFGHPADIVWVAVCVWLGLMPWPLKTKEPANVDGIQQLMGFKEFIARAEKDRLQVLLNEDPGYFENTVGYAMAFGMLNDWAHKFDDLLVSPPTWYNGAAGYSFTPTNFSNYFGRTMQTVRSVITTPLVTTRPSYSHSSGSSSSGYSRGGYSRSTSSSSSSSSRGSGYSGGGFGGGGGGSW